MKVIVLFKKPIALVFQKILFCFSTINIFSSINKNITKYRHKIAFSTIITFLPINQKLFAEKK